MSKPTRASGDIRPITVKKANVSVAIGETGTSLYVPALLTPDGALTSLLDYFADRSQGRSLSWMNKVVRAVGLFVRYASVQPADTDPRALLRGFVECQYTGTVDNEGRDSTGLHWRPASEAVAGYTITLLGMFFEFLAASGAPEAGPRTGRYDRLLAQCALRYRRDKTSLRYSRPADVHARSSSTSQVLLHDSGQRPAFPQHRLMDLLFEGFKAGTRHDYRCMLITLLLNGAGFAAFEPFHLHVTDVVPDPLKHDGASVRIPYPLQQDERLIANFNGDDAVLRAEYLRLRWASPSHGSQGTAFRANWHQPELEALFGRLWTSYMAQLAKVRRDHPFAFVNLRSGRRGAPYTVGQFNHAHAAACQRIGLQVARRFGTTLEGHRQAYEQRSRAASLAA